MPINAINISILMKLNVLTRLLNNNEIFNVACSKSGLSTSRAQKLMHKFSLQVTH